MSATDFANKLEEPRNRANSRGKRQSRWGSPPHPVADSPLSNTASIPLPAGPPIPPQKTALDFIPVPQPNVVRPPINSPLNLNNRPSALNSKYYL